jgi:exonuclease SbcC
MKILELRFKNLNSLYGEWFINFTAHEYISNGIFALTGPTGAGKSTILDAICLALYGATPRLGKITKNTNELISRRTGECYAEVVFESQFGRFRCHFSQHRARKKADGDLQTPRHEIAEAGEGQENQVIESQIRRVATVIEEKTGMDFERFTRSILLAQGGFDTFLKADAEQKSRILEQITGTEIYSEISRRVHERQREEQDKLKLLQAEISGIVILEPEQEKEIRQSLKEKQKQESKLAVKVIDTRKGITWLNSIEGIKREINTLAEESTKLQIEFESFKSDRERLNLALRAAKLEGEYATLKVVRQQQMADQDSLQKVEGRLPELENSSKQQTESLQTAEYLTAQTKENLKKSTPLIREIRSLDQKLGEQKKAILEEESSCLEDLEKIDSTNQDRYKEQKKYSEARKNLKFAEKYLKKHSQDEWLISGLTGVEAQLDNLLSNQKEIDQKEDAQKMAVATLQLAVKKFDDCTKKYAIQKQKLEGAKNNLRQEKIALSELLDNRLLREYRTEKENLLREMAFLAKIAELEDHRAKLQDGHPCPLCGAKKHPFAEGNLPVPDETERKIEALTKLISRAEVQENSIKKLEAAEIKASKNLTESEKRKDTAINEKRNAEKKSIDLMSNLEILRADLEKLKGTVLTKLQPLGITEISGSNISSLLKSLKEHLQTWQNQVKKKSDIEEQITHLNSELKRLEAIIETQSNTLNKKQKHLENLKKKHATESDKRKRLYGDKNPEAEEHCLNKAIAKAEQAEKQVGELYNKTQQKLNSTKTDIASLKERIEQRTSELKKLEFDFKGYLQSAKFTDEKQFITARLAVSVRDSLIKTAKYLDDQQTDIKARQKDRANCLATEIAKNITAKTLQELEPQARELEDNLKQIRDTIVGLKHRLTANSAVKERIKEKQMAIEAQKKECYRWEKLHGLIGSADGKKYRNFAQGITFELMVSHANRQLQKMTDRYLLIRDNERPLELNVADNYQAGEIRSTKNLSGGESFIVSLTLALGLSKMASCKVRVDSLFLDEGFGTLDENALETALETLSSLQQNGKLIGIISHISALQERISTQISITPISGGKSTINGPGCSRVENDES